MLTLTNPFIDVVVGCLSHCIPTLYHFITFKSWICRRYFYFRNGKFTTWEPIGIHIYICVCVCVPLGGFASPSRWCESPLNSYIFLPPEPRLSVSHQEYDSSAVSTVSEDGDGSQNLVMRALVLLVVPGVPWWSEHVPSGHQRKLKHEEIKGECRICLWS